MNNSELFKDSLAIIPARGGSKGLPGKNIKLLGNKPLIAYSLEVARQLFPDDNICITTDDIETINVVKSYNYQVPFIRPDYLAEDNVGMYEVLLHALQHYEKIGRIYKTLVLLQPTSPFRTAWHIIEAMNLFDASLDMVVSVKESKANPYYNLFEENSNGFIFKSKIGAYTRRQDCPPVYEYNGAVYVINISSLKSHSLGDLSCIKKYVMSEEYSIDIDSQLDWNVAELIRLKIFGA